MVRSRATSDWHPASWQGKKAAQQPTYPDPAALERAVSDLSRLPPLVTSGEIEKFKHQIAQAQRRERFVLQGGDCAESFHECTPDNITKTLKILLQMSVVLLHGFKKRVVRVGRIAGQYAKPRSADTETRDDITLPSYRGDLVNRQDFTEAARVPDPQLLLRGYERAALTLNFIRSLVDGGFADLHHPEYWDLAFMKHSPWEEEYQRIIADITESLKFVETVSGRPVSKGDRADFFTSHEGLHLPYEQAQTRYIQRRGQWYNLSTHFPWIGMRTAELTRAHVEFFRGIANPLGIKIGPGMDPEWLQSLLTVLNPQNEPGRIVLIHRFGAKRIEETLSPLIEAVQQSGALVLWSCDPMHGNTESTPQGYKTRRFENIAKELKKAFKVHETMGSYLGGVHFELTGENVTECTGGARGLTDSDLARAYRSQVDPRLNYEQAMELTMRIVGKGVETPA